MIVADKEIRPYGENVIVERLETEGRVSSDSPILLPTDVIYTQNILCKVLEIGPGLPNYADTSPEVPKLSVGDVVVCRQFDTKDHNQVSKFGGKVYMVHHNRLVAVCKTAPWS